MGIIAFVRCLSFSHLLQFGILLLWLPLFGCGSGSSGGVDCCSNGEGPTIDISFPLPNSNLAGETDRITLRGRAVAKVGANVNQVLINNRTRQKAVNAKPIPGLPDSAIAKFDDQSDPSRWSAKIPLLRQVNDIKIEASDDRGRLREVTLTVRNTPALSSPFDVVLDSDNNRALVMDSGLNALLAVDLTTGNTLLISGLSTGAGLEFDQPRAAALDHINNRALVVDAGLDALLAVDLVNGNRTVVSNATTGTGTAFVFPSAIALDSDNNRALVVDSSLGALLWVDLSSGDRTVISNATTGTGNTFGSPNSFALDTANNRALVVDSGFSTKALLSVDLATGNRTVISNATTGTGPTFNDPFGLAFDRDNNRVLVVDSSIIDNDALLSVDLANGNRSVISDKTIGTGPAFDIPIAVALDNANNRALVVDLGSGLLLAVDLGSGNRSSISNKSTGTGPAFNEPQNVALDSVNNRALVTDPSLSVDNVLWSVNLANGDRTVVSNSTTGAGPKFGFLNHVALDSVNNRVLVTDSHFDSKALWSVDLSSGDRTVISNSTTGTGAAFAAPNGVAFDRDNNRALVTDLSSKALLAVDLGNGDRTIISNETTGTGPNFSFLGVVALDRDNNRALVMDGGTLLAVDLGSGNRTVISNSTTSAEFEFDSPRSAPLDSGNNRMLVLGGGGLMTVDLASGERTVISNETKGVGPGFDQLGFSVVLDSTNNRALVVDRGLDALLVVDLPSGDRAIVSQ